MGRPEGTGFHPEATKFSSVAYGQITPGSRVGGTKWWNRLLLPPSALLSQLLLRLEDSQQGLAS